MVMLLMVFLLMMVMMMLLITMIMTMVMTMMMMMMMILLFLKFLSSFADLTTIPTTTRGIPYLHKIVFAVLLCGERIVAVEKMIKWARHGGWLARSGYVDSSCPPVWCMTDGRTKGSKQHTFTEIMPATRRVECIFGTYVVCEESVPYKRRP